MFFRDFVFEWGHQTMFWLSAMCRFARLRCYCGHSKIISLNVTSSISTFLGKMLTLLASVMKKCIRQKERHRSTFSLLIFQSPLRLWDSNVHGRVGYLYFFQSDHKKKRCMRRCQQPRVFMASEKHFCKG